MKTARLPDTDSIDELARFWDTHDLTDFARDRVTEVPGTPVAAGRRHAGRRRRAWLGVGNAKEAG